MGQNKRLLTVTFSAPRRQEEDDPLTGFLAAMAGAFPDRQHFHTVARPCFAVPDAPYIGDVLEQAPEHSDILIQPCFISAGPEWERLHSLAVQDPRIALGRPLLAGAADALPCAEALLPGLPDETVVFMAHGSKHPDAPDFSPALEAAFAQLGKNNVYFANLEGENGLEKLLPRLSPGLPVQLRPFLFHSRLHRQRDLEQRWRPVLEGAGHPVDCRGDSLCGEPAIRQLYIHRAREAESLWHPGITVL